MLLRVFRSFYHTLWYVVAFLILFIAIGISLLRLSLPYIDNFRPNIQLWLGDYVGQPVEIEKIEADWQGWVPLLYLQKITVLNKSGIGKITDFESAVIQFDPVNSLLRGQLIPSRIQINSPELTVIKQTDGSINITRESENLSSDVLTGSKTAFTRWLILQQHITIKDARLNLVNLAGNQKTVELASVDLNFRNIPGRTQINGSAGLPENFGESIDFAFDIYGDITTPDWSGELYLAAAAAYPSELLRYVGLQPDTLEIHNSPMTIRLWSDWERARVSRAAGLFSADTVRLKSADREQKLLGLKGTFAAYRNEKNEFSLVLKTDDYLTENGWAPANSINLQRKLVTNTSTSQYIIYFNHLGLDDVTFLFTALPGLADDYTIPGTLNLNGNLTNAGIIYQPALTGRKQFHIDSDFHQLSITNIATGAKISGLQGHIRGSTDAGRLLLGSSSLALHLPDLFSNTLNFYEIDGTLGWRYGNDEWEIYSEALTAQTVHFNSNMKGKLYLSADGTSRFVNLDVNIKGADLEAVNYYLPNTLPESALDWLDNTQMSGELASLDILLRGRPSEFPFENGEGRFQILANVNDATLDYSPDWTPVDHLVAELQINQNRLSIDAYSGSILSSQITGATATVANLDADKPLLEIEGTINGDINDTMLFINNSPLADSSTFRDIMKHGLRGAVTIDLELGIPLYEGKDLTKVNGNIRLFNAALDSDKAGIRMSNINGNIFFTRNSFKSGALKAHYANHDVEMEIESNDKSLPIISLSGAANGTFMSQQLVRFFPALKSIENDIQSRLTGTTDWEATFSTVPATADGKERLLTIASSLAGLGIDLPPPLGKGEEVVPLDISIPLVTGDSQTISFNYGDILSGIVALSGSTTHQPRATLSFGNKAFLEDGQGIIIDGDMEILSLSEWFNFIDTPDVSIDSSLLDNMQFDVNARSLIFFDQVFHNVNFSVFKHKTDWKISLNGSHIDGNIVVPDTETGKPLHATFERFYITEHETIEEKNTVSPGNIPPLRIRVRDFRYEDINLGKLVLNTSVLPAGMSVDQIRFTKPDLTIRGQGKWQLIDGEERSKFAFNLQADHLDAMLKTFNYSTSPVKDGPTTLQLDAAWDGSPADFSLANINGTMLMDIDEGQFLEIEPTAGRLFGLLSLQTLQRRLSLDFSDLFGKGLTFDDIKGNFTIQSGDAYTNNLTMRGPSADIEVTGRTGLVAEDYDQLVTVTPQFSDTLPVASALFGPVGVGVGAVLFLAGEMFESIPEQIDKMWRYQYTIKGSWDDPVVEKYTGKTKTSG